MVRHNRWPFTLAFPIATPLIGEHWIADDDVVSLDGTPGEVFVGQVARNAPPPDADLARILAWKERFAKGRRP